MPRFGRPRRRMTRDDRVGWLEAALTESIVILDGGMGTMIQGAGLGESD